MIKNCSLWLFTLVLALGCTAPDNPEKEIKAALMAQQKAWNDGNIGEFMSYYWEGEELTFASSGGIKRGHSTVLKSYLTRYDTPEKMGELNFEILEFKPLSDRTALVIGAWEINRKQDNPSGYFSLIWERKDEGWRIIHDHTS